MKKQRKPKQILLPGEFFFLIPTDASDCLSPEAKWFSADCIICACVCAYFLQFKRQKGDLKVSPDYELFLFLFFSL